MLINWKYPTYWKYKSRIKRPVRFQQDKKPCKLGDGDFAFVPPKHPDARRLGWSAALHAADLELEDTEHDTAISIKHA